MSRKMLVPRDMTNLEILNFRVQNLASAPSPSGKGHAYFDTTQNKLGLYNGSSFDYLGTSNPLTTVLTGLSTATGGTIVATDTILAAFGRVENRLALNDAKVSYPGAPAWGTVTGKPTTLTGYSIAATDVTSQVLTNFVSGAGTVVATDTILQGFNKIQGTLTNLNAATHTQNTDLGTSSSTFYVGTSGPKLKNNAGVVEIRNNADNAYADLHCANLTVTGTLTQTNSQIVNIGDSQIVLNADIATNAANSNGGIAVKRLMADNTTLKNAEINFNVSTNRWEMVFGDVASALITKTLPAYFSAAVGNGALTSFTLTHNFNNMFPVVMCYITGTGEVVDIDITGTTVNSVTVGFAVAPTTNQYTVVMIG